MSLPILNYHRAMLTDFVRMEAWQKAIRQVVRPGHVVVDLGTGTGILSFLACAAGARRVYAIEEGPIIQVARDLVGSTGFADRITFLAQPSGEVRLPERADVLLGDVFGAFGLNGSLLATMLDARERFLKPGGALLPRGAEIFCAPVEMPDFYARTIDRWTADLNGFDYRPCRSRVVNQMHICDVPCEAALSEPASLGRVELIEAATPGWRGSAAFRVSRAGRLHALGGWCRVWLTPQVSASNSPFGTPRLAWSQALFPIETPVPVRVGDAVEASFLLATHGPWMVWNWDVVVNQNAARSTRFRHSTFRGELASLDSFRHHNEDFVPVVSARGEVARAVLELCDGTRTVGQIREGIIRRFPESFTTPSGASRLVSRVTNWFCR